MTLQRYVSEELTHFVGSSSSDEEEHYSILVDKILKTGWLLANPKAHTAKAAEVLASNSLVYSGGYHGSIEDMFRHQVVCFCDIPVPDLEIHMCKYSRFGLSYLKQFLLKKGANPVLYLANNSGSLPVGVPDTEEIVGRSDLYRANARQFKELIELLMHSDKSPLALAARSSEPQPGRSQEEWEWQRSLWPKLHGLCNFLEIYMFSYIEEVDDTAADEDPTNVYMEREWRVLGNINFALSDVRRVFLPEEFAERFRFDLPEYAGQLTFSDSTG